MSKPCERVWNAICELQEFARDFQVVTGATHLGDKVEELATAFTDFECSWEEHAKEYHS